MLFCYEFFENIRGFILQYVQLRFEYSVCKYFEDVGIGIFDREFSAVWYLFGKYGIAVKIKEKNKVIVAADGWYDKLNCLISDYFSSDGLTANVSVISTKICCFFVLQKNDDEEGVIVSVTVLSLGMKLYNYLFLGDAMNGTGC